MFVGSFQNSLKTCHFNDSLTYTRNHETDRVLFKVEYRNVEKRIIDTKERSTLQWEICPLWNEKNIKYQFLTTQLNKWRGKY